MEIFKWGGVDFSSLNRSSRIFTITNTFTMEVPTLAANGRTASTGSDDHVEAKGSSQCDPPSTVCQAGPRSSNSILLILAAGCALLSDGYQNSLMTMANVVFKTRYGTKVYDAGCANTYLERFAGRCDYRSDGRRLDLRPYRS